MSSQREGWLYISGGFWLVIAWFGLVNGWKLLGVVLGAAVVHELGHCLALWLLGGSVKGLRLSALGAVLMTDQNRLSYGRELICVLAGPGANLLSALLLTWAAGGRCSLWTGAHLVLCLFNLLPLRPLDGGRALELVLSWVLGPGLGETLCRWLSALAAALLAGGVLWLVGITGGSLWLLPTAVGAFLIMGREIFGKQGFL